MQMIKNRLFSPDILEEKNQVKLSERNSKEGGLFIATKSENGLSI